MIPQEFIDRIYESKFNKLLITQIDCLHPTTVAKREFIHGIKYALSFHDLRGLSKSTQDIVLPCIDDLGADVDQYKTVAFFEMLRMVRERENKSIKYTLINFGSLTGHIYSTDKFSDMNNSEGKKKVLNDGWGFAKCYRVSFKGGTDFELDKLEEIKCKGGWPLSETDKKIMQRCNEDKSHEEIALELDFSIKYVQSAISELKKRELIG